MPKFFPAQLHIMGILNVTPDSFSDGGKFVDVERAVARALQMIEEGAAVVDVGGESTGPGSVDVNLDEELARVIPVIQAIRKAEEVRGVSKVNRMQISVDTWKSEVARQAIEAGANMVNDVTALRGDPDMARVVAEAGVPVVLMYSKDASARTTGGLEGAVGYDDVVATVRAFLEERIKVAEFAGIPREQIIVDPGMGAFVSSEARVSLELLERLDELRTLKCPILVGASRKSFIRDIWGGRTARRSLERVARSCEIGSETWGGDPTGS